MEDTQAEAPRRSRSTPSMTSRTEGSQRDYKTMFKELAGNPAVRYVAGGIATAILSRVAANLTQRYPEISRFIAENLDGIEGHLGEFKNNLNNEQVNQH